MRKLLPVLPLFLVATVVAQVGLPNRPDSLRFAVLGAAGTGDRAQYQVAEQMAALHDRFKYDLVILVGGNIYGSERPQDFRSKFEIPYKPLLDSGVKFRATLGPDDSREQRQYPPFNMDGQLYYTFSPKPGVRFFALESTYLMPAQSQWLEAELDRSAEAWKIVFLHQPLYSSSNQEQSDVRLRETLEPLFVKHNVSVVLTAQKHFYERTTPQKGIVHFVVGSGGKLQPGAIDARSNLTAKGFDADRAFLAAEIIGDEMFFNAVSRTGDVVDSGIVRRRTAPTRLP